VELYRSPLFAVNVAGGYDVLVYTYNGLLPIEVMARCDLGSLARPLCAEGGTYQIKFLINSVEVLPTTKLPVDIGVAQFDVSSKTIPLYPGDTVTVNVTGLVDDDQVDVLTTLRDATAVKLSQIAGIGPIAVDHNYGGTDALTYETPQGAGIDGATIDVYRKADYDSGNTGNVYVLGRATTVDGGRWAYPVMLSPDTYTLIYYKLDDYGPDRRDVDVVAPPPNS